MALIISPRRYIICSRHGTSDHDVLFAPQPSPSGIFGILGLPMLGIDATPQTPNSRLAERGSDDEVQLGANDKRSRAQPAEIRIAHSTELALFLKPN